VSVRLRLGNREPSLFDTIRRQGVAVDLTAATVKLQARTELVSTLVIDASATVISASTTLSATTVLPEQAITVASTSGFAPRGALNVGSQIVEYLEISGNTFLGCSGGEGSIAGGATVSQRGTVRYDWVAGDVDEVAEFVAWWEVTYSGGKIQESPTFQIVVEDPAAVSQGLCELADVTAYARGYRSDDATDALLERMILARSRRIQDETEREFRPISPAINPRKFDITTWHLRERQVFVGDLSAAPSLVRIIDTDQATLVGTVTAADYVVMPRTRHASQPITGLWFPPSSPNAADLGDGRVLEVTGTWGFPVVPDDIREACAALVVADYALSPTLVGTAFTEALEDVNTGALFASARRVIRGYARYPLAA
jgi:hypothetical protein